MRIEKKEEGEGRPKAVDITYQRSQHRRSKYCEP
jgi:hypothetical protein